jgi:hypothetical protein
VILTIIIVLNILPIRRPIVVTIIIVFDIPISDFIENI